MPVHRDTVTVKPINYNAKNVVLVNAIRSISFLFFNDDVRTKGFRGMNMSICSRSYQAIF